jgi:putative transposase
LREYPAGILALPSRSAPSQEDALIHLQDTLGEPPQQSVAHSGFYLGAEIRVGRAFDPTTDFGDTDATEVAGDSRHVYRPGLHRRGAAWPFPQRRHDIGADQPAAGRLRPGAHVTARRQGHRGRAQIILLAATGLGVGESARQLGIWHKTAAHWRRRWRNAAASAAAAARLSDAPRRGAPATFTPEAICRIMALACENSEILGVPIGHWSQSELTRQSVARGIVKSISHSSVGRFLKKRPISSRVATVTG